MLMSGKLNTGENFAMILTSDIFNTVLSIYQTAAT